MQKIVIIGGDPAGRLIVHALHNSTQKFDVTLIKDEEINANRCAVPMAFPTKNRLINFVYPILWSQILELNGLWIMLNPLIKKDNR